MIDLLNPQFRRKSGTRDWSHEITRKKDRSSCVFSSLPFVPCLLCAHYVYYLPLHVPRFSIILSRQHVSPSENLNQIRLLSSLLNPPSPLHQVLSPESHKLSVHPSVSYHVDSWPSPTSIPSTASKTTGPFLRPEVGPSLIYQPLKVTTTTKPNKQTLS